MALLRDYGQGRRLLGEERLSFAVLPPSSDYGATRRVRRCYRGEKKRAPRELRNGVNSRSRSTQVDV